MKRLSPSVTHITRNMSATLRKRDIWIGCISCSETGSAGGENSHSKCKQCLGKGIYLKVSIIERMCKCGGAIYKEVEGIWILCKEECRDGWKVVSVLPGQKPDLALASVGQAQIALTT